jgi:hypothetical protein
MEMKISDILVYSTPFEMEKNKWGQKWIGFYNGKRFLVVLNPNATEMVSNEIKNEYIISSTKQVKTLPDTLQKLIYSIPLSNRYFLYGKHREISVEAVMMLIEKGYNINNIIMVKYCKYTDEDTYLCRYIDKGNGKIIARIQTDKTILWKGDGFT